MRYCAPLGIPHSVFLEWSSEDQDKALAWMTMSDEMCPNCGTFPDEWTGEDGVAVDPPPYVAGSRRCFGCATLEREQDLFPKGSRIQYRPHLKPNVNLERGVY